MVQFFLALITTLQPWITGTDADNAPRFDYSELEPTGIEDSVQQQRVSAHTSHELSPSHHYHQAVFNKATKEERAKLEKEYPIGKFPVFPEKRVYQDKSTGFYFELNASRMGVWAAAMVCF